MLLFNIFVLKARKFVMFYAEKIGIINNSNNVVLSTVNWNLKSGRYVIIDKDKKDEFIAQNRVLHRKTSNLEKVLTPVVSIAAGVFTYSVTKLGHGIRALAALAAAGAGFVGTYKLVNSYASSKSKQIDDQYNVKNVYDSTSILLDPDYQLDDSAEV